MTDKMNEIKERLVYMGVVPNTMGEYAMAASDIRYFIGRVEELQEILKMKAQGYVMLQEKDIEIYFLCSKEVYSTLQKVNTELRNKVSEQNNTLNELIRENTILKKVEEGWRLVPIRLVDELKQALEGCKE